MFIFDLQPSSVLVSIFFIVVVKHLVGAIGKSAIDDCCWNAYTILASKAGHPKFVKIAQKRSELVRVNKERKAISAQDEYARWTKLNRTFDKLSSEVKALAEEVTSEKARVSKLVNLVIAMSTTIPLWFSRYWYRKTVLFYLAPGIFPHPLEWLLALPFTATGGIGLTVWMFALSNVLSSLSFVTSYYFGPTVHKPAPVGSDVSKTDIN